MDEKKDGIITTGVYEGYIYERLNPVIEKIANILFKKIDFDDESKSRIEECSKNGHIVYASFQSSNLSLLILYNLLKRYKFPIPVFALEYNPILFQKLSYLWKRFANWVRVTILRKPRVTVLDTDYVEELIKNNKPILFSLVSKKYFLKRYTEVKYDSLRYLIEVQKNIETPIYLMPQILFWNRNPERTVKYLGPLFSIISPQATGDKNILFAWLTLLKSATPPFIRISTPINLKEEIEKSQINDSRQLAINIRNKLLEQQYHEKRTILGPILKSQQEMMEKVLYHQNVLDAIKKISQEDKISETALRKKAYKYYKEIAANFSILYIRVFEIALDYIFKKIFDGITYDPKAIEQIRQAASKGPLVLTPCHKSHLDYLILSYIFYKNNMCPPHIAAGVNLSFFPMGNIFRHSGAFFMRRRFKGLKLYPVVFKQYIKTLISEGYTIEFFIEGGRSRTGKVSFPKLGFLNFIVSAIEEGYNKDVVFVPISINYDRILEESSYVKELKGKQKEKESVSALVQSRKLLKRKYGKVYLNFNNVFTLKEIIEKEKPDNVTESIAMKIVQKINEVVTITPFSLATTSILMSSAKGFSKELVKSNFLSIYDYCKYENLPMSEVLKNENYIDKIIDYVIQSFEDDKIIDKIKVLADGKKIETIENMYLLPEENRSRLIFYKNSIIHYFLPLAYSSLALRIMNNNNIGDYESFNKEFIYLRDLFKKEFVYFDEMMFNVEDVIQKVLKYLQIKEYADIKESEVKINNEKEKDSTLRFFGRMLQEYLESYFVVCKTILDLNKDKISKKELLTIIRKKGVTLYHTGEIVLSESLSVPNYNNGLNILKSHKAIEEKWIDKKNQEIIIHSTEPVQKLLDRIIIYLENIKA